MQGAFKVIDIRERGNTCVFVCAKETGRDGEGEKEREREERKREEVL